MQKQFSIDEEEILIFSEVISCFVSLEKLIIKNFKNKKITGK
jgi:hypothetical protein